MDIGSPVRARSECNEAMQGHEEIELQEETVRVDESGSVMQGLVQQIVNSVLEGSPMGLSVAELEGRDDDDDDDDDSSATFSICSCEGVDREDLEKALEIKAMEKEEAKLVEDAGSDRTPIAGGHKRTDAELSEVDLLKVAYVQIGALKSLASLLTCSQYMELLLIPKDELTKEKKDEDQKEQQADLQEAMRTITKQLVPHAIRKAPIVRHVELAELERAHSILYQVTLRFQAEMNSSLPHIAGMYLIV